MINSYNAFMFEISFLRTKERSISRDYSKRTEKEDRILRFDDIATVHETIHIKDLSPEEVKSSWYSNVEYKQIKEEISAIVAAVQSGTYKGDRDEDCLRGIEYRLKKHSLRRKKIKLYGVMVVLGEQEEQNMTGKSDANIIAQAYMSVTKQCAAIAHRTALIDESEANEYPHIKLLPDMARNVKTMRKTIITRILQREAQKEIVY
jgi:hypothetical protein